jgi:LTXXQ motif family protein
MFKTMLAGAVAVAIAGSSLAYAQYRGGPDEPRQWRHSERGAERWRPNAEDLGAFADARIAGLKAGLRLTAAQEQHWPAFEQALRERAKLRAERLAAFGDAARSDGPDNPVARMQRRADMMVRHAGVMKQVADTAAPLYQSLDEAQKRRFVMLARPMGPRHHFGPRGRGHDEDREGRDGPRPGRHMGPGFRL